MNMHPLSHANNSNENKSKLRLNEVYQELIFKYISYKIQHLCVAIKWFWVYDFLILIKLLIFRSIYLRCVLLFIAADIDMD